jgi:hypothetical protein
MVGSNLETSETRLNTIMSWLCACPRGRFWSPRTVLTGVLGALLVASLSAWPARSAGHASEKAILSKPAALDRAMALLSDSPVFQRDQLFARLGVDRYHQAGQRGRGIKVAILDSGFRDYRTALGKVLPEKVTVRSFRQDGNLEARDSQHGILCGEVVHAVAPEAELLFANWDFDQPTTFLDAARWAREQGARIVSCSLIMPSWSDGEGGGTINSAVAKTVGDGKGAGDVLFFASAGNIAQRHWAGPVQRDSAGYHQWAEGHHNNPITPWPGERVSVELYGKGCQDLEVVVYCAESNQPVGRSLACCTGSPSGCPCAAVRFLPEVGNHYYVRVRCDLAGKQAAPFHLVVLGGGLHYTNAKGSVACPADGAGALAVGAVDSDGLRLNYSSCGPNSSLPKPDFVAEVPFPSLWRDRPFAGTSAAAPQAAGLAALVWGRHPDWTAAKLADVLRQTARDLGPKGHDDETGHGLLVLP